LDAAAHPHLELVHPTQDAVDAWARLLFELGRARLQASGRSARENKGKQDELVVSRLYHGEAVRLEQLDERGAPVPPAMCSESVAGTPETGEGRHGDNHTCAGTHHARELADRCPVVNVLQDVEGDREVERRRLEGKSFGVSRDDPRIAGAERIEADNAVGVLLEDRQERARPAADVEGRGDSADDMSVEEAANERSPSGKPEVGAFELGD
jgi:hypothetical protein